MLGVIKVIVCITHLIVVERFYLSKVAKINFASNLLIKSNS